MTTTNDILSALSESQLDSLVDSADEFMKTGIAGDTVFRSFSEQVKDSSVLTSDLIMIALSIYHYATGVYRERLEICQVQNADPNDYRYFIHSISED